MKKFTIDVEYDETLKELKEKVERDYPERLEGTTFEEWVADYMLGSIDELHEEFVLCG